MELKDLAPWNWFKKSKEHEPEPPEQPEEVMPEFVPTPDEIEAMNRFFDNDLDDGYWSSFSLQRPATPLTDPGLLRPYFELAASGRDYVITIDIPNVKKDDIHLDVSGKLLTVTGKTHQQTKRRERRFSIVESSYGSFKRQLVLPEDSEPEALEALYRRGQLLITLPKKHT